MGDKKSRWNRSDAEQFKRRLIEDVERVDALTRAGTIRIADADRDKLGASLSTCDVQQFNYLLVKLQEIMANLVIWHDHLRDALDRRGLYEKKGVARRASQTRSKSASQN
jgi:hypothetical protein